MADIDVDAESKLDLKPPPPPKKVDEDGPPQQSIDEFWKKFTTKHPGKPFTILPNNLYAKRAAIHATQDPAPSKNAVASYDQAAASCRVKVEKIVRDCRRLNQKYKDLHFDVELDFMQWQWDDERIEECLNSLDADISSLRPMSVKRVEDIFDDPQFWIEGMTANDVRQGRDADCWFMSSICTLSIKEDLLEKVCVAMDEKVGVYGFVFHRDGEWISEVIDDKLYLAKEDFHDSLWERYDWLEINIPNPDDEYRKVMQTGSKALYFAQCRDQNETWLPLLEKAYAKAHGDYAAIEGGWVGEGLEDLTGGVTSEFFATGILDKDKFWNDELMNVNKLFLFGLAQMGGRHGERSGIIEKHAYSIMEARELDDFRLLKIRNPWGKKEWDGPWSDGSEEWTPDRMQRLNHQFGNDGAFWISYKDLLKNFQHIDRTRLFGPGWSVTQQWTSVNVPWSLNYLDTHFKINLSKNSPVVIVLTQLDERYFLGLTGQYCFQLQFRLHKDGDAEYITRNNPSYFMFRSVSTELDLEAGQYSVFIKITATRDKAKSTPEEIIRKTCQTRPDKLMSVGLSYDLTHAKGSFKQSELERKERLQKERRDKRKNEAKRAFEAKRKNYKKEKLGKRRLEAKEKAKRNQGPESDQDADDKVEITIKMGENTLNLTKPRRKNDTVEGKSVIQDEEPSQGLKVTVETNDEGEGAKDDDQARKGEQQQPVEDRIKQAGDPGQSLEDAKDKSKNEQRERDNTGVQDISNKEGKQDNGQESSTFISGLTPKTSNESGSAVEDISKAEDQPSTKKDETAIECEKTTDIEATVGKRANATESGATDPVTPWRDLTLDNISDDGLSWSSDIDAPSDTSTESDTDDAAPSSTDSPQQPSDKPADDFVSDPWNAVCVVGLRVYSKEGSQAEIEVARKEQVGTVIGNKKLDVDDQAADATKTLQKGTLSEEKMLESVRSALAAEEGSKQG